MWRLPTARRRSACEVRRLRVCASNLPLWEGKTVVHLSFEAGQMGHEGWGTVDGEGVTNVRVEIVVAFFIEPRLLNMMSRRKVMWADSATIA